jgi:hypothetical protein
VSFGRNPYVIRAQAAEQKAANAPDEASRVRACREAAHQWDRAAERERPGRQRAEYEANATKNRSLADGDVPNDEPPGEPEDAASPPDDPMLLN